MIQELLKHCPFIENLAVWEPSSNVLSASLVSSLQLRRLSIGMESLFGDSRPDFRHHPFPNLTHLEILEQQTSWSFIEDISLLESLSHLAFNECSGRDAVEGALKHCKRLRVVIHLDGDPAEGWFEALSESEVRVVVFPNDLSGRGWENDWDAGTTGGDDVWARADAVVEQRLVQQRVCEVQDT